MKRLSFIFSKLKFASRVHHPFLPRSPYRNYLAILPFLVISQQHFLQSHCFFNSGPKVLYFSLIFSCFSFFFFNFSQKNKMESRVAAIQYQSNNPLEDTYSCEQVVSGIEGYLISVFDGHGGWQLCIYPHFSPEKPISKPTTQGKI